MSTQARDPVAALAQVLADLFADHSYSDRPEEFMGEARVQVERLAEQGYVLVNVEKVIALGAEHRQCGTPSGYDGCFAHFSGEHCRADGMPWPCDVAAILATMQEQGR